MPEPGSLEAIYEQIGRTKVMQHDNGTFEWLDGDGIWLPRRAVEGTFTVIGSFDARKANL